MPAITVASVFDEARGTFLNDAAAATYTNTVMLPHLKTAYEHLRNELALNDIPTLEARTAAQTIAALGTVLTSVPTDLLLPIHIEERTPSSTEQYIPMSQRTWPPNIAQQANLCYWDWRQEAVEFLGATTAREIRMYYLTDLNPTALTTSSTGVLAANSRSYLAARVASLVAMFIQQNSDLAQACNMVADSQLSKVIRIAVKERQGLPTRHKPFLGPRRLG